jgi:hypothetical protein
MSDSEENLPSDIELAAQSAIDTLIPAKSKERYEIVKRWSLPILRNNQRS